MGHSVRSFAEGDEVALCGLFNAAHGHHAGVVPRTAEYWRWSNVMRPGMRPEGIVVAERDGEPVGYAAVDDEGTVLEMAFDPTARTGDVVRIVLDRAAAHARDSGASRMVVNVPRSDRRLRSLVRGAGFAQVGRRRMYLGVYDYGRLLEAMAAVDAGGRRWFVDVAEHTEEAVRLDVRVARDGESSRFRMTFPPGELTSVVVGRASPLLALIRRRIRVEPISMLPDAYRLLVKAAATGEWFFPLGDVL